MQASDRSDAASDREVEGTVPSQWYLDIKIKCQALEKRLAIAEAYIPQRDFADYRKDADRGS